MAESISDQVKASRAEYYRQWRAKNPEKVREKNRRYWERRAAKENAKREAVKRGDI